MTVELQVDDRSERILEAIESLICERGYDRVRFVDVADAASVSIGSLQHRFRNREGMLRAALERADDRQRDQWLDLIRGNDEPWERLIALVVNLLSPRSDAQVDRLWLQLLAVAQRDSQLREVLQAQQDRWATTFAQVIAEGMSSGRMKCELSADEAGLAILALTDGLYLALTIGNRPPPQDTIRRISQTVIRRVITSHDS